MIINKIAMETAVNTRNKNSLNNRNTSLKILMIRYVEMTEIAQPQAHNTPIIAKKAASRSQKPMLILSRGSFVFIFFTSCTIFMTFFLTMRHCRVGRYCLRAISV